MAIPDREQWRQLVPRGQREVPDPMMVVTEGGEWSRLSGIFQHSNLTPFLRSFEIDQEKDMVVITTGTRDWSSKNEDTGYKLELAFNRSKARTNGEFLEDFMSKASGEVYFVGTERELVLILPTNTSSFDPLKIVVPYSEVHFRQGAHHQEVKTAATS